MMTPSWQELLQPHQMEVMWRRDPVPRAVAEPIYEYRLNGRLRPAPPAIPIDCFREAGGDEYKIYVPPVARQCKGDGKREILKAPTLYLRSATKSTTAPTTVAVKRIKVDRDEDMMPAKKLRLTRAAVVRAVVRKSPEEEAYTTAASNGFPTRYQPTEAQMDAYDLNVPRPWRPPPAYKPTPAQSEIIEYLLRPQPPPHSSLSSSSATPQDTSGTFGTTILVEGPGGSGKSQLIGFLQEAGRKVMYCTVKHSLRRHMHHQFDCAATTTFASLYLELFQLRPTYGLYDFHPTISGLELETVQAVFDRALAEEVLTAARFGLFAGIDTLIIDEYSTLAVSMLKLVLLALAHGRVAAKHRLDVVLLGDPHQLPPIQYRYDDNNFMVRDLVDRVFQLTADCRFASPTYAELMSQVRRADSQHAIYALLVKHFSYGVLADRSVVELTYPFHDRMPECQFTDDRVYPPSACDLAADFALANRTRVMDWLGRWHAKINDTLFLARRNLSIHKYSLAYASLLHAHTPDCVEFVPIRFVAHSQRGEQFTIVSVHRQDRVPVLPLIRGADYVFLANDQVCKRGEILTYLGRRDDVLVLSDARGLLVAVHPQLFQMRLLCSSKFTYLNALDPVTRAKYGTSMSARQLYGYPLQLAVAQNIFQSQGLTYRDKKLYINVNKTSKEETYVALSRTADDGLIKNIFICW